MNEDFSVDTSIVLLPNDGKTVKHVFVRGKPGSECKVRLVADSYAVGFFPINTWRFWLDETGLFDLSIGPVPAGFTCQDKLRLILFSCLDFRSVESIVSIYHADSPVIERTHGRPDQGIGEVGGTEQAASSPPDASEVRAA